MRISDWSSDGCSSDLFDAALSDDLMVPRALPLIEEALSMKKVAVEDKLRLTAAMDMALGLNLMTITRADLRVRPKDAPIIEEEIERSEEHTSELQSLMRISYAVFCLKKKTNQTESTKT